MRKKIMTLWDAKIAWLWKDEAAGVFNDGGDALKVLLGCALVCALPWGFLLWLALLVRLVREFVQI